MSYKKPPLEPIAIVGTGCRFAGGVDNPSKLWDLLSKPIDLAKEVPEDRFSAKGFYHPDGEYHGTTNSTKAYWLEQDFRAFDASFFKITPKEAEAMDPQQRMTLEVVYEALESAGYTLNQLSGQKVSVFAGLMTADYDSLSQRDELTASQYYATGNARSILSNRVSYFFNWRGPSMTLDTACSSSLVALHQAVLSLRAGESTMACVAGANLMLTPEQFIVESNLHMLSPTGHSRMWDADADGYARGEGIAAVFLKPLSQALKDGDVVQAVIRETGVNSDGRTQGITMPNPEAQTDLIRETYRRAGLDSRDPEDMCQYFEAHGTGTQAGDPREAQAIEDAFFGEVAQLGKTEGAIHNDEQHEKLLVGSVKTIIGHVEGAAGLAGLLKVVQSMHKGFVPPNLHLEKLNPSVQPFCAKLKVPTNLVPWPPAPSGQPRRASVNSFGFGGTNSHAIVEHYVPEIHDEVAKLFAPELVLPVEPANSAASYAKNLRVPILLSANSPSSLQRIAEEYLNYIQARDDINLGQLALNMLTRRTAHPYRVAVSGASEYHAIMSLESVCNGSQQARAKLGHRARQMAGKPRILVIFTGQGAQYATMSKDLFQTNEIYRNTIQSLDSILKECQDPPLWSLEGEIMAEAETSQVGVAAISQPLCTALQIGLVDVAWSLGVEFACVVGHSSGEIAAAYAAGRLTAKDAILIAHYRGACAHLGAGPQGEKGGMCAVGMSKAEAEELCAQPRYSGKLCVAASNSPSSVTISGDADALWEMEEEIRGKWFARRLQVQNAYHSHHMKVPAEEYIKSLEACIISPKPGNKTIWVSSLDPDSPTNDLTTLQGQYWADNMLKPVLFNEAVSRALRELDAFDCVLEVGPHPALRSPTRQIIEAHLGNSLPYSGMLDRKQSNHTALADFIGFFWTHFGPDSIDVLRFIETLGHPELLVLPPLPDLPTYQWDHSQVHHRESRVSRQYQARQDPPHELLGVRTRDDTDQEMRWRNVLKIDKLPWLDGHKFQGQVLLPASAYCVLTIDAAKVLLKDRKASLIDLEDLEFLSGITIEPESEGVEILFTLQPQTNLGKDQAEIKASFTLSHAPAGGTSPMKLSFTGKCTIYLGSDDVLPARKMVQPETLAVSTEAFYQTMAGIGLNYSGPFKSMTSLERRFGYAKCELQRFHEEDTTTLSISPATLDSCLQACFATFSSPGDNALWTSFLPKSLRRLHFNVAASEASPISKQLVVEAVQTKLTPISPNAATSITGDVNIYDGRGKLEIHVEDLTVSSFASTKPKDDYELYLHTVMKMDPEDGISFTMTRFEDEVREHFVETFQRVCRFYLHQNHPASVSEVLGMDPVTDTLPLEDEATVQRLMLESPFYPILESSRRLALNSPYVLGRKMPLMYAPAVSLHLYQQRVMEKVSQVTHKYPQMNVLSITSPNIGLSEWILKGLGTSFNSCTLGSRPEKNLWHRVEKTEVLERKLKFTELDLNKKLVGQLDLSVKFDLVILSGTVMEGHDMIGFLHEIKDAMTPGGFLFISHVGGLPLKERLEICEEDPPLLEGVLTPPEWPDHFCQAGFVDQPEKGYLDVTGMTNMGFSLTAVQSPCPFKESMRQPLQDLQPTPQSKNVMIIGGGTEPTVDLVPQLEKVLQPSCGKLQSVPSFAAAEMLSACTAVIILADIDGPLLSSMDEQHLEAFKSLLRPDMVVLWVTHGALDENPESAASFGFARTVLAETPGLVLQMLDFDELTVHSGEIIAETFARLMRISGHKEKNSLWTYEPEVYIRHHKRYVARVMPFTPANMRVNAVRRVVEAEVNTLAHIFAVEPQKNAAGFKCYTSKVLEPLRGNAAAGGLIQLHVMYSTAQQFVVSTDDSFFICLGTDACKPNDDALYLAMSSKNASFIEVPASLVVPLKVDLSAGRFDCFKFMSLVLRTLQAAVVAASRKTKPVIIVLDDEMLAKTIPEMAQSMRITLPVLFVSTEHLHALHEGYVHPNTSSRELRSFISQPNTWVYDFCEQKRVKNLPDAVAHCEFSELRRPFDLQETASQERLAISIFEQGLFGNVVKLALQEVNNKSKTASTSLVSVQDLLDATKPVSQYTLINWKAERVVATRLNYSIGQNVLEGDCTYVLVGITKDLGQSLCALLVQQGARNIVLASRNPNKNPRWARELKLQGVRVEIEALDVTDLDAVEKFRDHLKETMPPVDGVVNGAMILDDRVFSQMTLETWHRVMRPKTVGSKNLSMVFDHPNMSFFIMTSSFAAIGGHAGQSNYASANMYMNGLAAERRRRGRRASVLNIGVIYGLGFLHREKDNLYDGLEREGYPPISERDLHHMFLEAIVECRDLTTGLRRFRVDDPNPLHWHRDPRFSHFTVEGDDASLAGQAGQQDGKSVAEQIKGLAAKEEILAVVVPALTQRLETLLRLPAGTVMGESSFAEIGIDSLVAVEIRSWIWKTLGKDMPVMKILSASSILSLCSDLAGQLMASIDKDGDDNKAI